MSNTLVVFATAVLLTALALHFENGHTLALGVIAFFVGIATLVCDFLMTIISINAAKKRF